MSIIEWILGSSEYFRLILVILFAMTVWCLIRYSKKDYGWIFTKPHETWKKLSWKKTLIISAIVLLLMFQFFPIFSNYVEENYGEVTNSDKSQQVQATKSIAEKTGIDWAMILIGLLMIPLSIFEECVFRGIFFDFIADKTTFLVGLTTSSGLFAVYHLQSAGYTVPFLAVGVVAGLVFGLLYKKGGILLSSIVHSGWNFGLMLLTVLGISLPFF